MNKIFVLLFLSICLVGIGSSAECGTTPTEGCTISTSTTFDLATYLLNGSSSGVIRPTASNLIINCNGATFTGNRSDSPTYNGRFINLNGKNNITLINCNINNYLYGVYSNSVENDTLISNNTFNNTKFGLDIKNTHNFTINNNTFNNGVLFSIQLENDLWKEINIINNKFNSNNQYIFAVGGTNGDLLIENNSFNMSGGTNTFITINNVNITKIINNSFIGVHPITRGVFINGITTFTNISNNNFTSGFNEAIFYNSSNGNINNNNIYNSKYGIKLYYNYSNVSNNYLYNVTYWGIDTEPSSNYNNISHNNLYKTGWDGLQIRGNYNNFSHNYLEDTEHHPIDLLNDNILNAQGKYNQIFNNIINRTLGLDTNNYSDYIGIQRMSDNIFRSNVFYGGSGIGGRAIAIIGNFTNGDISSNNFFINNSFDNITKQCVNEFFGTNNNTFINNTFTNALSYFYDPDSGTSNSSFDGDSFNGIEFSFNLIGNFSGIVNITEDYYYFDSNLEEDTKIKISSLTNALIYNTNGTIYGSSTISQNDGNVNITLQPGNSSYVLDNFNLTEGITRTNSPLWFTSSTTTSKHIGSNLTDMISATVVVDVYDCELLSSIGYVSDTGTYTKTFNTAYIDSNCADNKIILTGVQLETASSSNILTLYTSLSENSGMCSALPNGLNKISSLISTILIVGITVLLFTILGFLVFKIRDPDYEVPSIDFSSIEVKILISGIGGLIILSVITLFVVQTVCSLG
jgi:hypothetical protein